MFYHFHLPHLKFSICQRFIPICLLFQKYIHEHGQFIYNILQEGKHKETMMSDLVVIAYDSEEKANEIRSKLMSMSKEYLLELEDAVVAVKKDNGKVKLQQMYNLTASGAVSGGFLGALIGLIFLNPILGAVVGAGAGAASGALTDLGINDAFMKQLAESFKPGTSLLFVLIRKMTKDKVMEGLQGTGGTVIKTSLTHEDESRLRDTLDGKPHDQLPTTASQV